MKQKLIYISLLIFVLLTSSCKEDKTATWQGKDYIHFANEYQDFYSFVYAGSTIQRDTVNFKLNIAGNIVNYDRTYKINQVKSYDFIYEYDELGNIVDSAFIEVANQAIPNVHYVDLESSEYSDFIVPADSLSTSIDIVLLRDKTLKDKDYVLTLEVQESPDFYPGYNIRQKIDITISDKIIKPTLWESQYVGSKTVYSVMGLYGKIKHQMLIDITGQRWDNDFIKDDLTEEYLLFYNNIAIQELNRINDERASQGLHPLREDDSNPNSEIKFKL